MSAPPPGRRRPAATNDRAQFVTTNTNALMVRRAADKNVLPVLAPSYDVVGQRGRSRAVAVVSCPFCHEVHVHEAVDQFESGRRQAACGGGAYVVVAVTVGRRWSA